MLHDLLPLIYSETCLQKLTEYARCTSNTVYSCFILQMLIHTWYSRWYCKQCWDMTRWKYNRIKPLVLRLHTVLNESIMNRVYIVIITFNHLDNPKSTKYLFGEGMAIIIIIQRLCSSICLRTKENCRETSTRDLNPGPRA